MPSAFVLGGRGQSGLAIGRRLVEGGWTVTATTSGPPPADGAAPPEVRWTTFDRTSDDLAAAVPAGTDVVVDVVAFTAAHAAQLAALGDRIGSAVVLSTVSVYSDAAGRSLDEAEEEAGFPDWPVPIPESQVTLAPGDAGYSERKVAVEQAVRAAAFPVTIVRPAAIHGRYSRHLREWYFIKRVLDRRRSVVLPFRGAHVFQPTATVNLAELVALAAADPGRRTLNCGDLDPPSPAGISAIVDELMGWETERIPVDGPAPAPGVGDHPFAVPHPVVVDMSLAAQALGYRQAATYAQALRDTIGWAVAACHGREWEEVFPTLARYPTPMFDYAAEDAWLASRTSAR
jgi:nucleoside-diphosphate-sugar epimerase